MGAALWRALAEGQPSGLIIDLMEQGDLAATHLLEADLGAANLCGANLEGSNVTEEQMVRAETLEGATMPDGTKWTKEKPESASAEPETPATEEQPGQLGDLGPGDEVRE